MPFKEFQDGHYGGNLGYRYQKIFAILNQIPLIKFQLNLTCSLIDVVWRISRWQPWWQPPWISEWNNFSNSESLCHCDTSYQVSASVTVWVRLTLWEEMLFEEFQDHLGYGNGQFEQFGITMLPQCLPLSFSSIQLMVLEEMSKMWKANKAPDELTMVKTLEKNWKNQNFFKS